MFSINTRTPRAALRSWRLLAFVLCSLLLLPGLVGRQAHAAPSRNVQHAVQFPNGTLIRDTSNGKVYLIWAQERHWIDSPATLTALGYDPSTEVAVSSADVNAIPNGTELGLRLVAGGLVWPLAPITNGPVSLTLSVPSASPGQSLRLDGSGFAPNETITLTPPNSSFTVQADAHGSFTATIPVLSNVSTTLHHIFAQGNRSGRFGVQVFYVIPVAPAPAITAAPNPVSLGTTLSVSGSGFASSEPVQVFVAGGAVAVTTAANGGGAFGPLGILVPSSVSTGAHTVSAYGTSSHRFIVSGITVTGSQPTPTPTPPPPTSTPTPAAPPAVTVNPSTVGAGAQVVIGGSGFAPGEVVLVRFNGTLLTGIAASSSGTFSGFLFTVPVGTASGTYSISATGATSGRSVSSGLTVQAPQPVTPASIAVSPVNALPGARVLVAGTGYAPGETVLISFNNSVVQSVTADAGGSFTSGTFIVPSTQAPGRYGISVAGATSGRVATAVLTVSAPAPAPVARAYISPSTIVPGEKVSFGGSGFAPHESILVRINGTLTQSLQADAAGAFGGTYTVKLGFGQYTFTLTGASSGRSVSVLLRVARPVMPGIGLVPNRVTRGSTVKVNGNNFVPGEVVLIRFRGALVQATTADGSGRFSGAKFTVPGNAPYGVSAVTITGARSGRTATASLLVVPARPAGARIKLSATTLHRNSLVSVSGSGYMGKEIVLIRFHGSLVQAVVADSHGNFSRASFRIPVNSAYGKFGVSATGARSGRSSTVQVRITPAVAGTSVAVSSVLARRNQVEIVSGHGYMAGEIVLIRLRGVLVQAATADRNGNYRVSFRVSSQTARGTAVLLATGARSGRHAQVTLVIA